MPVGVHINGDKIIGGRFSALENKGCRQDSALRSLDELKSGKPSVGIDWDCIKTKYFFTEETNVKKIKEITELQKEYLDESDGEIICVSEKGDKGSGLFFLQAPIPEVHEKAHVYPDFAALYALASREGVIASGSNLLAVFFIDGMVMTIAVENEKIVFARKFADNGQLAMNLKISSQSVFFLKQRRLINADKTLVISANEGDFRKVEKICGEKTELHFLDISGYFADSGIEDGERSRLALAYGLSLAPKNPELEKWNFISASKDQWKKSRWVLARLIILILLGIPVILGAEIITNKMLVYRIDRKEQAIAPLYKRVGGTISMIQLMKSFAKNSGRNMIGPDICYNLFSEIDKARSNNLWFTSISGDPYKTVSLNGTSADYPTMLKFLDKLAVSKKIKKPQLLSANLTDKGRVDFEIVVSYKFSKAFAKPKNDNGGDQEQ